MNQLVLNRIRCNSCQEEITSYSVHDYQSCKCGKCAIDGGVSYRRFLGDDFTDLAVWSDDPFEKVREACYRRGFGKVGAADYGEYRITILKDMTDEHLQALLSYCAVDNVFLPIYMKEIEYRKENNIQVPEI